MRLEAGDVLVVPHGQAYALTSEPGLRTGFSDADTLAWFRDMSSGRLPFVVEEGGGGPERIGMVCGFLGCDALPFNPVLATLPPLVRVRLPPGDGRRPARPARSTTRWPSRAIEPPAASRCCCASPSWCSSKWCARTSSALPATPAAGSAGCAIPSSGACWRDCTRSRPSAGRSSSWRTTPASRAPCSPSASCTSPACRRCTTWRAGACSWRRPGSGIPPSTVAAIAQAVGYDSEAAFSRAFKRYTGVPPSRWRAVAHPARAASHRRLDARLPLRLRGLEDA